MIIDLQPGYWEVHLCSTVQTLSWAKQGQQVSICAFAKLRGGGATLGCRFAAIQPWQSAGLWCPILADPACLSPSVAECRRGAPGSPLILRDTNWRYFPLDNPLDNLHYEHTESEWCFVLRERGEIFLLCFQKGAPEPMWQASCLAAPCATF